MYSSVNNYLAWYSIGTMRCFTYVLQICESAAVMAHMSHKMYVIWGRKQLNYPTEIRLKQQSTKTSFVHSLVVLPYKYYKHIQIKGHWPVTTMIERITMSHWKMDQENCYVYLVQKNIYDSVHISTTVPKFCSIYSWWDIIWKPIYAHYRIKEPTKVYFVVPNFTIKYSTGPSTAGTM